jgi:FkbM family methyltransferase
MKWHRRIAHWLGYELIRLKKHPTLASHLAELFRRQGISTVIDVGANVGQYGLLLREIGFRGQIFSFEPVAANYEVLRQLAGRDGNWIVSQQALAAEAGEMTINVTASSDLTSFHVPNEHAAAHFKDSIAVTRKETVPVSTLNAFFEQYAERLDKEKLFLKLDTQGFDLEVVKGGQYALPRVSGLQVELSFLPLYQGAPHYLDALRIYESHGFHVTGLYPICRDKESLAMMEMDCVMVRRG